MALCKSLICSFKFTFNELNELKLDLKEVSSYISLWTSQLFDQKTCKCEHVKLEKVNRVVLLQKELQNHSNFESL